MPEEILFWGGNFTFAVIEEMTSVHILRVPHSFIRLSNLSSSSAAAAFLTTYKSCKIFLSGFPLNCYNCMLLVLCKYILWFCYLHNWLFLYFWTYLKIEKHWIPLSTIVILSSYQSAVTWGMVFCFEDYSEKNLF